MKTSFIKSLVLCAGILIPALFFSQHNHEASAHSPKIKNDQKFNSPAQFKAYLMKASSHYLQLKEGFISEKSSIIVSNANKMRDQLEGIDMNLLKGEAHNFWITKLNRISKDLQKLGEPDGLDSKKVAFSNLSAEWFQILSAFGTNGQVAYYQFCPMALDNQGAHWISDSEEIRNPYFGEMMLKCGKVESIIK